MSIADKITSIEEHLQADWESIENLGGSAEDKNIENIATSLNEIYDNLPKTTGEDTNLSLNTLKGKMNTTLKGDTEQDSATGSNLMNTEKLVNGTYNGLTITKDSDDFINISGTATANTPIVLSEITYNFPSTLYISYENNFTTNTAQLSFLNGSTTLGGLTFSGANRTYDMSTMLGGKTCTKIELYITSGNTINGKFRPMLNTQSGQTYSKYAFPNPSFPSDIEVVKGTQEVTISNGDNTETQTQIVSLGDIELCKIGTYQDYLYKSNDKWYKKEYIGKYTFTGNETIDQFSSRTNTIRFSIANVLPTTLVAQEYNYNAYCNYLKAQDIYNNDVQGFFTHFNGISATRIYIGLDKTIASTSEQAKTWLGNVKPILYYQLRTPSDIEITQTNLIEQLDNLQKLKSYNGITNINCSGNLSAILSVSALKGE